MKLYRGFDRAGSYHDAPPQEDYAEEPDNIDAGGEENIEDTAAPVVPQNAPKKITTKFLTKYERGTHDHLRLEFSVFLSSVLTHMHTHLSSRSPPARNARAAAEPGRPAVGRHCRRDGPADDCEEGVTGEENPHHHPAETAGRFDGGVVSGRVGDLARGNSVLDCVRSSPLRDQIPVVCRHTALQSARGLN